MHEYAAEMGNKCATYEELLGKSGSSVTRYVPWATETRLRYHATISRNVLTIPVV